MLTDRQEKFCKLIALYGFSPADAAKEAGYQGNGKTAYCNIGRRLIDNPHISSKIAELRESYFDIDAVRRSIILRHMQTLNFKVTDYVHHLQDVNDNGNTFYRLIVKPYDEWDEVGKRMCIGFDKNNIPIFRSCQDATKELCKIFGVYKDNIVVKEEDTSSVLSSAGLTPSFQEAMNTFVEPVAEFDGSDFDKELGVADEEDTPDEDEDDDDDFYDFYDD